jgi:hypothetical protein
MVCSQTCHRFAVKSSKVYVVVNNGIFSKITAEQKSRLQSHAMCEIQATSAYLDATVTVNFKDAGDSDFFRSVFSNFFLAYRCHNTEHVHVPLSQYKTCVLLDTANINACFWDTVFWDVLMVGQLEGNLPTSETTRLWKPQISQLF